MLLILALAASLMAVPVLGDDDQRPPPYGQTQQPYNPYPPQQYPPQQYPPQQYPPAGPPQGQGATVSGALGTFHMGPDGVSFNREP